MKIRQAKSIEKYKLSTTQIALLWLTNYEACSSLKDSFYFIKYYSINEFANHFVMSHPKMEDSMDFRFRLVLDANETNSLKSYLLSNKDFVVKYILSNDYFEGTHLYQLYLQYLSYELTDIEKYLFLDGYFHMMTNLYGKDYTLQRKKLEKELRLCA